MTEAAAVHRRIHTVAFGSIGVAFGVMAFKYWAYLVTGSVALYSDALESIVNVVTAVAALVAVKVSSRPADRNHQFGHHKAEYLSAVLEGALIVVAALLIFREAYFAILSPRVLDDTAAGFALNAVATGLNGAWSWFLVTRGRAWQSPALVADGKHLLSDVITSVGVLVGLVLAAMTGYAFLDPLMAIGVALYILWSGYQIVVSSMSGLLDEAVDAGIEERIRGIIQGNGKGALEAHDIRTRHAGRATFIEFHLVVPGKMTVHDAHIICDRVEDALELELPGADVLIHVEPEYKRKPQTTGAIELREP